jgi:hypothetical protein
MKWILSLLYRERYFREAKEYQNYTKEASNPKMTLREAEESTSANIGSCCKLKYTIQTATAQVFETLGKAYEAAHQSKLSSSLDAADFLQQDLSKSAK